MVAPGAHGSSIACRMPRSQEALAAATAPRSMSVFRSTPRSLPAVLATRRPAPPMPAAPSEPAPFRGTQLSLSEVLTALSHALDLTEGQPLGHTVRTCLIGMRLAEELGLSVADRSALYYALLLKDAGCSSNAAQMSALFGADDRAIKPRMKIVDWHRRLGLAVETFRCAGMGGGWRHHVRRFLAVARTPDVTRDLIRIR